MRNKEFDPGYGNTNGNGNGKNNSNGKSDFFAGLLATILTSVFAAVLTVSYIFHSSPVANPFGTYRGHFSIWEPVSGEEFKIPYEFKINKKEDDE